MAAVVASLFLAAIALTDAASISRTDCKATVTCTSEIYCQGDLLKTIQLAKIFNDSKTYVDLSQLHDPSVTIDNFRKLMEATNNEPNRTQLTQYLWENFVMEDELHNWTLPDWKEKPRIVSRIEDPHFRKWAMDLNAIWKTLARKMDDDVAQNPSRHSLIYVENGFIIPGGRFKEFYYWDSYWVIEGLLLCDMSVTAKGMIDNFLYLVQKFGFIPNGGRVYYLMRSQPPLLIPMFAKYLDFTKDYGYLSKNLPILEKEFNFWQRQRTVQVQKGGKTYTMARYIVDSDGPRPESYREDYRIAQKLPENARRTFYEDIKAAAESGWDFSWRWAIADNENGGNLSLMNVSTRNIIPVDLNSILQRNARFLAEFHTIVGNIAKAQYYRKIAANYQAAIDNVLWNEEAGAWFDYDMKNGEQRKSFYPSNLVPLYTQSYNALKKYQIALQTVQYLKQQKIDSYFGGTPASLNHTGEQWDFPNAWPPLQSFLIIGLYRTGVKEAMDMAAELAGRWLRANYAGYDEYGKMFEKYDAIFPGQGGGGGEYVNQEGFGWTNGIVFEFLNLFPSMSSSDVTIDGNEVDR